MSVLKVKGNLYVSIWSPKVGSVDIGPGYPMSRASFADAVRRARYLWDEIHKADSDLLTPQCHSDLMQGGFSMAPTKGAATIRPLSGRPGVSCPTTPLKEVSDAKSSSLEPHPR